MSTGADFEPSVPHDKIVGVSAIVVALVPLVSVGRTGVREEICPKLGHILTSSWDSQQYHLKKHPGCKEI